LDIIEEGDRMPDEMIESIKHTGYIPSYGVRILMCIINIVGYSMILS
jgi:hypothetical protein